MRAQALAAWIGLGAVAALGCSSHADPTSSPAPSASFQPLVLLTDWSSVSRDEDPFVTDAAAAPACVGPGFVLETDYAWLEIDTGVCNWVTLKASARDAVSEGQQLQLVVSHYDLNAAAPAEALLQLRFEDCDAWSTTIPIPSAA